MLKLISQWKMRLAKTGSLQKFLAKAIAGTFGLKIVDTLAHSNSLLLADTII